MEERILCSAIWLTEVERAHHRPINTPDGVVYCGYRHNHCIATIVASTGKRLHEHGNHVQGFLTNKNRFVDRVEGGRIAVACGQIEKLRFSKDELYSEDLY